MMAKANSSLPKLKINYKLIIGVLGLVLILVAAILVNSMANKDTSSVLTGAISIDNGDQEINWNRYPTTDVELTDTYEITKSGTYHLTGALEDGKITINAKNEVVKLILDNVSISNSAGPAISCLEAEDLVIELVGENTLEDGANYANETDEDITGTIYSKADLTIEGSGGLNITGNFQDGIVSKDDLKIKSGTYVIDAADDGIRGKDSVYIVDGNFTINSASDSIKSTNEIDAGKGFVLIEKGNFNLISAAKGIKAFNTVLIYDGIFDINSYDDSIHSDNYIGITNGQINIDSGDDGIHANSKIIIDGGEINIDKAYEGIEAQAILINDGKITVKSTDDGINAGGGADSSATNRKGAGAFDADEDCVITINGGQIYVNASGDGIDSNGYVYFNGGRTIVDGPTNNGNGALDAGAGVNISGGDVIAVGASGMAVSFNKNSSVYNLSIYLASVQAAGTKIEIKNSQEEAVVSHTSAKTFSHMTIGSEKLYPGETYTIYLNDQKYQEFIISDITTTIGNSNNNFNNNFRR